MPIANKHLVFQIWVRLFTLCDWECIKIIVYRNGTMKWRKQTNEFFQNCNTHFGSFTFHVGWRGVDKHIYVHVLSAHIHLTTLDFFAFDPVVAAVPIRHLLMFANSTCTMHNERWRKYQPKNSIQIHENVHLTIKQFRAIFLKTNEIAWKIKFHKIQHGIDNERGKNRKYEHHRFNQRQEKKVPADKK